VVPPSLEAIAREILEAGYVLADASAGGMKNNVWKGSARLLVAPELAE
jgi:phage major head subunit gpT-like protein